MRSRVVIGPQYTGKCEVADVATAKGCVILGFAEGTEYDGWHAAMGPAAARKLAAALYDAANDAEEFGALTEDDIIAALSEPL